MNNLPNHRSPPYSEVARQDALFHYTTANGLIGIIGNREIWSTAYFCANDESELAVGRGILAPLFLSTAHEMIRANDTLVQSFTSRGIDIRDFAQGFEQKVVGIALRLLCPYITCFCIPKGEEDFKHGLLSQWRGYGADGGYALQFSMNRLLAEIEKANQSDDDLNYQLQDIHYSIENPLKSGVLRHSDAFIEVFKGYLRDFVGDLDGNGYSRPIFNPLPYLPEGL